MKSIDKHDFLEGVYARKNGDRIELVYGHHRLKALELAKSPEFKIEMPFKENMSDVEMIQLMVKENSPKKNAGVRIIDEGVKAARDYLEENRDELREILESDGSEIKRACVSARAIFLLLEGDLTITQIEELLKRWHLYEKGISMDVVHMFPTAASAHNFVKAAEKYKANQEAQEKVAEYLISTERLGHRTMEEAFLRYNQQCLYADNPARAGCAENRLRKATSAMKTVRLELGKFVEGANQKTIFDDAITIRDIHPSAFESCYKAFDMLQELITREVTEIIIDLKDREPSE